MSYDPKSRKWIIVINNPLEKGFTHNVIIAILQLLSLAYWCLADEVSSTGTYHTHIFILSTSNVRFSTLKDKFPGAHLEKAYGTVAENKEYILKGGKWADSEKADTSVDGTFAESGELPNEVAVAEAKVSPMQRLVEAIEDGMSTADIIRRFPGLASKVSVIDEIRERLTSDRYLTENRDVEVCYLFGATGAGKTRSIFEKHKATDICRITNYGRAGDIRFDAYHGQPVLVLEEFHGQIPIPTMLNLLDVYPLMLPARYYDRVACYTKVYITSNLPLAEQYQDIQKTKPETWKAFLRRIHNVIEFLPDGTTIKHKEVYPHDD